MAECKWCANKGFLVRIDSNGLCKKCEDHAPLRIIPAAKQMKHFYDAAYVTKTITSKVSNFNAALSYAELLLPYESKGIPTCNPLPSVLIGVLNTSKDEMIAEEMEEICTKTSYRVSRAKSPKGIDAACHAGLKKLQDISISLFDQGLVAEYKERLERLQSSQ